MKVNFDELSTINLENINLAIVRLEKMLEGKIDTSNIAYPSSGRLPVPSDNVVDLDIYINSDKVIADPPSDFVQLVGRIDDKLSNGYDLSTLIMNTNVTRDDKEQKTSGSRNEQNSDTRLEKESFTTLTRTFSIDKASDFVPVNYGEFFGLIYDTLDDLGGELYSTPADFVQEKLRFFLLDSYAYVKCMDISWVSAKCSDMQIRHTIGELDFSTDYLTIDVNVYLDVNESEASDNYSFSLSLAQRVLMRRIL